jgi:cell wall-associated NlpC family hydrolase
MAYYARYRYRPSGRMSGRELAMAALLAAGLAVASGRAATHAGHPVVADAAAAPSAAATEAIAYARAQLGCPYVWAGVGPCSSGYDCSGLVMMAWRSAGVDIARTSQEQWATLPHIPAGQVRPGDLVFFPGGDGTWTAPGHVALVLSSTQMEQAYAPGTPLEISPLNGDGAGGIVGFARP